MRNDAEYMFASARIRAAEGRDTAKVRLDRMLECRSPEQLLRTVVELGFLREDRTPPAGLTEALDMALDDAASLVRTSVPEPELYHFLFYKYDCNNIKVALKAGILGLDYSGEYYACGTFDPAGLAEKLQQGNTEGLPAHMGEAVAEATAAYAETGEGRVIDFCLDRACFADTADCVNASGVELFRDWAAAKADVTNILSSVRLSSRGTKEAAGAVFARAFVPGGTMPMERFLVDGCMGYEELQEVLEPGLLKDAVERILAQGENARPEKEFENALHRIMNREKFTPFGVHIPAVFFVNREAELKNCRILAAALTAGISGNELRERIRVDYV